MKDIAGTVSTDVEALKRGAIYVDDSGNPGADSGSAFLPASRKSWTAVIVPSVIAADVETAMRLFLGGVRKEYGAHELHFTDVWSGKGPWKGVKPPERAKVFGIMASMMEAWSLPVIQQTVSEDTLNDHPDFRRSLEGVRQNDWRLDSIEQFGFLSLCSAVSRHVLEMKVRGPAEFELPLPLFVDEGMMLAGRERALPNWADAIEGPNAHFRRSSDLAGLQIADFAAFVIGRSQWAIVRRQPTPEFTSREEVILRAASALNILNLTPRRASSGTLGKAGYEDWLQEDREAKGLPRRPPGRG
ncbi:MAG: DUF3800 domain-containing protein [Sphingomonas pseudosanguinis]|uniref:DUF3800 domain-containing protein n=1 Tax=Sphingomonas pseudosanguinis TaxID=413712 RepID=UPI00391B953F